MPKKKSKKVKKNGKGVGGKADVHAHEEGKRNKSLLGHNAISVSYTHLRAHETRCNLV